MSWVINNLTAPDNYTAASTLQNIAGTSKINVDVTNAAIFWQLQQAGASGLYTTGSWSNEVFMAPGSRSLIRDNVTAFRFRAAVPAGQLPVGGAQAQVTVEAS